eukprot:2899808-Pleurochrysis_carterae.AAC.1
MIVWTTGADGSAREQRPETGIIRGLHDGCGARSSPVRETAARHAGDELSEVGDRRFGRDHQPSTPPRSSTGRRAVESSAASPMSVAQESPMSIASPPESARVPRVILRFAKPIESGPTDTACNESESEGKIADLARRLERSEAEVSQLRSTLRNVNHERRMLEAQLRQDSRAVRKQIASIRAASWMEMEAFKASQKVVGDDLRYLKYERNARRLSQQQRDEALKAA